jgi:Domain of unknown function (DUF4249)
MKYIVLIISVLYLLTACIPTPLSIDVPEVPREITVASQILPNRILVVFLTNSFSSLTSGEDTSQGGVDQQLFLSLLIDKALVTVTYGGKTEKLTRLANGVYATINAVQINNERYTLFVRDSATGREVTATTTFLPNVSFDTISAKKVARDIFGRKDTVSELSYQLTDLPAANNYYMVDYLSTNQLANLGNNFATSGGFGLSNGNNADLFTDLNLGTDRKIKFTKTLINTDTLVATLFHITKEYYEFQSSAKRSGNFFAQVLGEPVNLQTNVKNGQGFFNMAYPTIRIVAPK